jgi:CubicO group peptidase (beta-lactamase class C family)
MNIGKQDYRNKQMIEMKHLKNISSGIILVLTVLQCISCNHKGKLRGIDRFKDQIKDLVQDYHQKGLFDGVVLVGDTNNVTYQEAFGLADRAKKISLTIQSQFYLASVSKQFTATAMLLLIQKGEISPDDQIMKYLPELPNCFHQITFQNLLNHTSGIPDYYEFAQLHDDFTNGDVLNALLSIDSLEFVPGTKYKYSNSGYVLLSILVERISGKRFAEFLKENILDKAGLRQTIVYDEYAPEPANRVIGYGTDSLITDYRYRTTGGGGIFSNVEDLYKWHLALLAGKILEPDILQLAYSPCTLKNDSTVYYGFGWNIDPDDPKHVFHGGDLEGFRTWFDRRLDNGKIIVLLSNNSSEYLEEIAEKIWRFWPDENP